jgi:hypothetical protein
VSSSPTGYSGTPLARKLGYKKSMRATAIDAPANYENMLAPLPPDVTFERSPTARTELVHVFVTKAATLASRLEALRRKLNPDATVWVSWPKKASKVPTDVSEDVVRELALPLGFVDVKVCAVDDVWSGLKLVVRKELRGDQAR